MIMPSRRQNANRHKLIIGHVQKCDPQIDVALAARGEEKSCCAMDGDTGASHGHNRQACDLARRGQAAHALCRNDADRHQHQHRIGKRSQNGGAPQAICVGLGRCAADNGGAPCQQ